MEDLTKLTDAELSEGIEILSEQAAETWNEQIQFGDSGPGSARRVSAYLAYQAEYQRRHQQKLADRALSPVPVLTREDRRRVRWFLSNRYTDFADPHHAAKAVAHELGHDEWLEDQRCEVWDLAEEFYTEDECPF